MGDKGDVGEEINPPPAWCVVFPVSDAAAAEAGWRRMVDWLQWRDRALGHDAHWVRRRWWRPGLITASDVTPKMRETLPGYPVDVRMNGADEHATPLQAVAVVREGIPSTARHGWVVVTNRLDRIGTVLGASNASGRPPVAYIHAIETPAVRASRPQPDGGWTPVFAWDAGLTPDDRAAAVRYLLTDRRRKRGAPAAVATDDNATYGELFWRDVLERVGGLLLADENGLVATRPDTLTIRGEGQGGALLLTGAAVWTADAFRALAPRAPDHAARRLRTLTALAWAHKNADLGATGDFPPTLAALLHVRAEDGSLLLHNYYTRFERLDEPQPLAQWLTRAAHGQELDGYWFTMRSEDSSDHSWLFSASPLPPAGSPADTPVTRREAWERAKKHDWPIFRIAEDGSIASQPIPDD